MHLQVKSEELKESTSEPIQNPYIQKAGKELSIRRIQNQLLKSKP
jgi:hypothetical protein